MRDDLEIGLSSEVCMMQQFYRILCTTAAALAAGSMSACSIHTVPREENIPMAMSSILPPPYLTVVREAMKAAPKNALLTIHVTAETGEVRVRTRQCVDSGVSCRDSLWVVGMQGEQSSEIIYQTTNATTTLMLSIADQAVAKLAIGREAAEAMGGPDVVLLVSRRASRNVVCYPMLMHHNALFITARADDRVQHMVGLPSKVTDEYIVDDAIIFMLLAVDISGMRR